MTRKSWLKPPHSDTSRPGSVKATTLADVAKPDKPPKDAPQCRICLEPQTFGQLPGEGMGSYGSSLVNGICRDREACEERQPSLIPLEEL